MYIKRGKRNTGMYVEEKKKSGQWSTGRHKGKFTRCSEIHPRTGNEDPEWEWRYSSTLSLTSALDGVGGQRHAPAVLSPGKTRYPFYMSLRGPQGRSGGVRKISPPPPGFDPQTVQPLASRYTDCAVLRRCSRNRKPWTKRMRKVSICPVFWVATCSFVCDC